MYQIITDSISFKLEKEPPADPSFRERFYGIKYVLSENLFISNENGPHETLTPLPHLPQPPGTHHSTSYLYGFDNSRHLV